MTMPTPSSPFVPSPVTLASASRRRHRGGGRAVRAHHLRGRRGRDPTPAGPSCTTTPEPWPRRCRPGASRPGDHVAVLGPTTRRAGHRHPGHLAGRGHARGAAAADAAVVDRAVRGADPGPHPAGRHRARAGRRRPGAVHRARARRSADGAARRPGRRGRPPRRRPLRAAGRRPRRLAVLQFTSGSTAEPKGVMLSHRAVCANLDAIEEAAYLDRDDDVMVSWLPLYHDMGLIGFWTLPMTHGRRPGARRAAGLPGPPGPLDGVALAPTAARPPPGPTSPACWPPGPCAGPTGSTCPACASPSTAPSPSTRHRSRRSSRPAPATACARARCSRPSAWPRSPSPAPSRCR